MSTDTPRSKLPWKPKKVEEPDASATIDAYLEYNRVLRTWFVAFGVAGPALFLVNERVAQQLAKTGSLRLVAFLFLAGAMAQVIGALINKTANWYIYMSTIDSAYEGTWKHKLAEWVIRQYWIDLFVDLATIVGFAWAAWEMFTVFAKGS